MRNKNKVTLNETQLKQVIKESVKRVIREDAEDDAWNKHRAKMVHEKYPKIFKKNGEYRKGDWRSQVEKIVYGTDQANKRPLHRKGSMNRELMDMDKVIKESIRKVLKENEEDADSVIVNFLRSIPQGKIMGGYGHTFEKTSDGYRVISVCHPVDIDNSNIEEGYYDIFDKYKEIAQDEYPEMEEEELWNKADEYCHVYAIVEIYAENNGDNWTISTSAYMIDSNDAWNTPLGRVCTFEANFEEDKEDINELNNILQQALAAAEEF